MQLASIPTLAVAAPSPSPTAVGGAAPMGARVAPTPASMPKHRPVGVAGGLISSSASPSTTAPHAVGGAATGVSHLGVATAAHQLAGAEDLGTYYAPADGKTGAALLHSLHEIVRTGHVDRGYAGARDELFSEVYDLDGDDKVEDVFTGESRGPITGRKDAMAQGFNTEHTWPQSQGATGIAQSDLHHLFPADIKTNEVRGSLPYGEVVHATWSTGSGVHEAKRGVDALGNDVTELAPAMRGDVARGLLYFYTRYYESRPGRFTTSNFTYSLPTLLKWNQDDPVDDVERARNAAIQRAQGNRNPYVDRPEFVDAVDFSSLVIK